jgi:hypothetical protein
MGRIDAPTMRTLDTTITLLWFMTKVIDLKVLRNWTNKSAIDPAVK